VTELHPIQLHEIGVTQLSCVINDVKAAKDFRGDIDLEIKTGISDLVPGDGHIAVGIQARVAPDVDGDNEPAFEIKVELSGQFEVDLERFKFEDLTDWAKINAPFLLLPYVREQIYGLGLRAGMTGLVIPLFVQPRKFSGTPKA
jgi:preprotein translocase subunit SecB